MNTIFKTLIIIVSILSIGCSDLFDEINTNPNDKTTADVNQLFTYSVVKGISAYNSDVYLHQWGIASWMMHLAPLGGVEAGKEYEMPTGKDNYWAEQYTLGLRNANEVVKLTKGNAELINKTSIANIWQAFLFLRLTDLWGAIPYSDALKGLDELILMPAYNSQKEIYMGLFDQLKNAAESLDNTKTSFGDADPIYKGDVENWKRFANSIRLRMAIRIKYVEPELAQQIINELEILPLIETNEHSALFPYNWDYKNPFAEIFQTGQDNGKNHPSNFFMDYLKSINDPRIGIYAEPTVFSLLIGMPDYVGIPNLVSAGSSEWDNYKDSAFISFMGEYFTNVENPGLLLTHAEVCFLKAEAALEGWISGTPESYLEEGIRSEFKRFGLELDESKIESYLNNLPDVTLELIITQKWVAFAYLNSYEAYADYRRTGYPVLTDYYNNPINENQIPKRLTYPSSEVSLNYENYLDAIKIQGEDKPTTNLWWNN
ncbi:MAG: SusD/RagB family nutrient-binding outer membrane lipoprotein [Salinivirgaceae bacterium]|nr:SusD/RagB family nutrient-binding outer membrane lipoprotein [Salinivirgaceae bacterium]